jgi:hypothetical protein
MTFMAFALMQNQQRSITSFLSLAAQDGLVQQPLPHHQNGLFRRFDQLDTQLLKNIDFGDK